MVSLFAVIAMVLAMVGIRGTMSHNVAQGTSEIGVRVAFGARKRRILTMVLREGLLLDVIGIGAGLGMLLFFSVILRSQLCGVRLGARSDDAPHAVAQVAGCSKTNKQVAPMCPAGHATGRPFHTKRRFRLFLELSSLVRVLNNDGALPEGGPP
jgi:hypothetical protein